VTATLRAQLGAICRGRRTDLDISQDALARSTGVSRGYVATIETGRANPTLDVVERLGHSLGVDLTLTPSIAGVAHLRQRDLVRALLKRRAPPPDRGRSGMPARGRLL
jgi:transcriptional regulator with XRE-family HTH domain